VDTRRSYCFAQRQDDFAEVLADAHRLHCYEILYAAPANDNSPTKDRLLAGCWSLVRRLVGMHRSSSSTIQHENHRSDVGFP
jgi:hypothetical protein